MRLLAVVTDAPQALKILRHLIKIAKPPPGLDPATPHPYRTDALGEDASGSLQPHSRRYCTGLLFFVPNWLYEALSVDGTVWKEENAMFILKELDDLYDRFSGKANAPNLLDGKTKELIALACSVMVDCVPCIEYHHGRAVECGATEDEIKDALGITMSIAAGSKRAKYGGLVSDLNAKIKKDARTR